MKNSILRRVLLSFLGFGVFVAGVFPFYANIFVEWKPGMLPWFVVGCFIAGLFIGVANYWMMNVVLVSKLRRISEVAGAIARKDLTFTCGMRSDDTIGEIITSFNNMAATLRDLISHTVGLSHQVRQASDTIRGQVEEIHGHVDEQAERTGQINNAMQNLASTIGGIAHQSSTASNQAKEAGEVANQGIAKARESIQGMERIHASVSSATERVAKLGESSQQIGAIVAAIKEIADQTNLLALNAAIEAARAGEQGRGFAVVADEVRKLAEKTTQATSEIGTMIHSIQEETGQAIDAIASGMSEAQTGVTSARQAGEALEQITTHFDQVLGTVQEIAQATERQKDAVQSVLDNIEHIEALNTQTVSNSEQGVSTATRLSAQAIDLDAAVKGFKLD
ncbi:MAG: methyl-accepting chemotaxis protein [Betaproteobacteria bacterium]|nr:methyl-accepting chemotaxis protein [Betaproteobacteria bacterium]